MSLDTVIDCLKNSLKGFKDNAITFIVATLIAFILCNLIVTIPPLMYGLVYMAVKASRGEKVSIGDVFFAFRSVKRFVRSWIYGIVLFIVVFIILIVVGLVLVILNAVIGETTATIIALIISFILSLILFFCLFYAEQIFVMNSSIGVVDALKESLSLSKSNIVETIVAVIIVVLLEFIGCLVFGILVLVTTPISFMFLVYMVKAFKPELPDTAENV